MNRYEDWGHVNIMRHERLASRLGVKHESITLRYNAKKRRWKNPGEWMFWTSVELASLSYYRNLGWEGTSAEGRAILHLIKAMSFEKDSAEFLGYYEGIQNEKISLAENEYGTDALLERILSIKRRSIKRNLRRIKNEEDWPALPYVNIYNLFKCLGRQRIREIAEIFSTDPYEYSIGWPDLTLWRNNCVSFKEIKAPGDKLQTSQRKIFTDIMAPLSLDASIVDVMAVTEE